MLVMGSQSTDPFFLFHNYPSDSLMRKAARAFQHFYMLPVLSLYWLSSVFNTTAISVTVRANAEASPIAPFAMSGFRRALNATVMAVGLHVEKRETQINRLTDRDQD